MGLHPTAFPAYHEELKLSKPAVFRLNRHVSSLPMRMKQRDRPGRRIDHPCFQPTYEELKPMQHIMFAMRHISFQPTYEELKLAVAVVQPVVTRAFPAYL